MRNFKILYAASVLFFALVAIFFVLYAKHAEESSPEVTREAKENAALIVAGDIMLDRFIREVAEEKGGDFLFSCADEFLKSADVVIANLEGSITNNLSQSVGTTGSDIGHFTFTFPTSTAALLNRHNIKIVNLGNNHILNFGKEGLAETRRYLEDAGIEFFGDPINPAHAVLTTSIQNVPLAFISYNEFWYPEAGKNSVLENIRKAKEEGRVAIVYAHWGNEYVPPPARVRALAHEFIDAGANIVIGSHPHVVQESEIYNGAYIYYSLGNFIFDQYFSEEVRDGLALKLIISSDGQIAIEEFPVRLEKDGRTCATQR